MQEIFFTARKTGSRFPNSQTSDCTAGNKLIIILILTHLIFNIIKDKKAILSLSRENILLLMI
jgi:hypothetical protein